MTARRPIHIETQDPKFFVLRREILIQWSLWFAFTLFAVWVLGVWGMALSLVVLGYLLLMALVRVYHRLQIEQVQHYWQTEALFSLYSTLKIDHPLPPTRLWAASPDFLNLSVALIREHRPQLVLEIGSGVSTVVNAYALRDNGEGRLISLDHDAGFARVTAENLRSHHLEAFAEVRYAPLQTVPVISESRLWYDLAALDDLPGPVDLLIVDGPPSGTGDLARYPALPLLFSRLGQGAWVLVDDFGRDDEHAMVNRWLREHDLNLVRVIDNEKGAVILQKTGVESHGTD